MNKKITIILFILVCIGCVNKKHDKDLYDDVLSKVKIKENKVISNEYNTQFEENSSNSNLNNLDNSSNIKSASSHNNASQSNSNVIIMNLNSILKYNETIKSKADMVYDVYNLKTITKDKILSYINSYKMPSLPQYNYSTAITEQDVKNILNNRAIENVHDGAVVKGIIVERANLRSFPTDKLFKNNKTTLVDNIQQTELHVNTPVLLIHESLDKKWGFVITPFYVGWVEKSHIAIATDADYEYFLKENNFGIITDPEVAINNTFLDMSVKLPYIGADASNYKFVLPIKGDNNYVGKKIISIPKSKAHIGYLAYTKENVINQASKYLGVKYSWGGANHGVDCSSYVSNVYRTFGFLFPRNTSSQNKSVGTVINIAGKTPKEKLNIIAHTEPSLLYQPGHVMLYIGMDNGKHYILHANGNDKKVAKTELNSSSQYLKKINRLVLVK